jgi:hypothetical protein
MIAGVNGVTSNSNKNSDESSGRDGDVNEMRAFMRMFMDLVGIFNEDQSVSQDFKLSGGISSTKIIILLWIQKFIVDFYFLYLVSFGMMFGSKSEQDEWSTEGDDDDEDDEDEDDDDYDDDYEDSEDGDGLWEPMAKNYIHMNLKEEASKRRINEMTAKETEEMEAKRKLKNAKKRAEKRRKQKEKKLKEATRKAQEEEEQKRRADALKKEAEDAKQAKLNNIR